MLYVDDDVSELNPDLVPKPNLWILCKRDDWEDEEKRILCNLTRLDERGQEKFICFGFTQKVPKNLKHTDSNHSQKEENYAKTR